MSALVDRVRQLVAPILADLRLELYDLEHVGGTLRITVDRAGGVDLDALSLATRLISRELDHNDPMPGRYTLEITSPGLERPLRTAEHFGRAVGSRVQIRTLPHVAGDRRVHGVLAAADDDGFVVRLDAVSAAAGSTSSTAATAPAVERRLDYADVERARTVFEWGGQPKRGAARPRQAAGSKSAATSAPATGAATSAPATGAATGSASGRDADTSGDRVATGHTKAASTTRPSHGKKGVVQP